MKELIVQCAEYNVWANNRIINLLLKLEPGIAEKELTSSFPTLKATVIHMWSAESIWLQRLQLTEHPQWIQNSFAGSFEEACLECQKTSSIIEEFVKNQYDDRSFSHIVQFYDWKKLAHKMPVFQVLHHIFNHSTYHRGQLTTMLREAGIKEIPMTDFIVFAMKLK